QTQSIPVFNAGKGWILGDASSSLCREFHRKRTLSGSCLHWITYGRQGCTVVNLSKPDFCFIG
ncbi:MAG: hypothetical protein QMD85_03055, partial [Candidatus Aenigmarchaeota archaeon]|nr:hypothetical protein [Candidatus Aenigmarchaeota archaeon]